LDVLYLGSAKTKDIPFLCAKDLNWDEEKLGALSIINVLANGNCCKISGTLIYIFRFFGISFTS